MIASFADAKAKALHDGETPRGIDAAVARVARRKLDQIAAATHLLDLRVPPGNRLELLIGDRRGCHSIRVNSKWRLVFVWRDGAAHHVELVDYHP